MIKLKNILLNTYKTVTSSIAFYPTFIAFGFLLLSVLAINLRSLGVTEFLMDKAPFLVLSDADTSRTILSTLIGGLLSFLVFSFSMVMLLLSQASSNYSPRLLPGLISERRHQIVLGTYLGTIVYCIFVLISILPGADAYQLPGFAILMGIIFGIVCMGMFVYFIHSISQAIQISNILLRVFRDAAQRLNMQNENETRHKNLHFENFEQGQELKVKSSGYFQNVNSETLSDLAKETDSRFKILAYKGMYALCGVPIILSEKKLDEETQDKVLSCLKFSYEERVDENYVFGFKQITEIAVKAMSPGINDPGTAISALDYLSELFALRMRLDDTEYIADEEDNLIVSFNVICFKDLAYNVFAPIRRYSREDVTVMSKMLQVFEYLVQQPMELDAYREVLQAEANATLTDIEKYIENKHDRQTLLLLGENLRQTDKEEI